MSDSVKEVRAMVDAFRDAIVGKDAARLGSLFTPDAEFVNIAAMRWSGREAIAANHAKMFAGPLQITLDITRTDVKLLREDVALVSAAWKREVAANSTGPTLPPGNGEFTFVATRGAEGWRFAVAHNTQAGALPGGPTKS